MVVYRVGTGRAHRVLDADAMLRLPGVPTVADVTRGTSGIGETAVADRARRTLTVLRCGPYRLAIRLAGGPSALTDWI